MIGAVKVHFSVIFKLYLIGQGVCWTLRNVFYEKHNPVGTVSSTEYVYRLLYEDVRVEARFQNKKYFHKYLQIASYLNILYYGCSDSQQNVDMLVFMFSIAAFLQFSCSILHRYCSKNNIPNCLYIVRRNLLMKILNGLPPKYSPRTSPLGFKIYNGVHRDFQNTL